MSKRRRSIFRGKQLASVGGGDGAAALGDEGGGGAFEVPRRQVHGRGILPRRTIAPDAAVLEQARQRAEGMVAEAEVAGAAVRQRAQEEVDAAVEVGRQQGYQAGLSQAQNEMMAMLELVRSVGADAKQLRDAIYANSEEQLLRLVAAAAQRVIGEVVAEHPDAVLRGVEEALRRGGDQRILRVRVHPESREIVEARYGPEERDWELRSDGAIALGGCIVDTEAGVIDASIEGQIAEISAGWEAQS